MTSRIEPVFLDSSGIIAFLASDDAHHVPAVQEFNALYTRRQPLVTTAVVLCEVGDGFACRHNWEAARPLLERIYFDPQIEVVSLDLPLLRRALDLKARRQDKRWGLTDCVSFVVMQERGISTAFTADHDFVQAGFRALLLGA